MNTAPILTLTCFDHVLSYRSNRLSQHVLTRLEYKRLGPTKIGPYRYLILSFLAHQDIHNPNLFSFLCNVPTRSDVLVYSREKKR